MTEKDEITGLWHYEIRQVSARESDIIEVGEYEVSTRDFKTNLLNVHVEYEPDKDCFLGRVENNKGEAEFGEDRFHLLKKAAAWGIEKAKSIVEEEYDLLGFVGLPDENKKVLNKNEKYGGQGAWMYQDYTVEAKHSPEFDVGKLDIPLWTLNTELFVITAEYDPANKWYVGCVFDKGENVSFGSKDRLTSVEEAARWGLKTALSVLKMDKELLDAAGLPAEPKRVKD